MRTRRSFAAVAVAFSLLGPRLVDAQASLDCDGSIRAARERARLGNRIFDFGMVAQLGGFLVFATTLPVHSRQSPDHTRAQIGFAMMMSGSVATLGSFPLVRSAPPADAVDDAIQQIRIGETTTDDILRCLGDPTTRTFDVQPGVAVQTQPAEESWVYRFRGRSGFFRRTVYRTVTISFKSNVVSRVQIAESR
jgi:hypothetical protein